MSGMSIVQYNIRSALCVPLWESEQTYGVLYVDNLATTHAFTRADLELLTAICNLVAIRIKQDELREKLHKEEVLRTNLSKYHSPDVVERLLNRGDGEMEVVEREVTVLFADIVASTTLAEKMGPTEVTSLLNQFFEMATTAVFDHHGSVNKFIGDEVMAIFNAPLDVPDHGYNAVQAAVKIIKGVERHNENFPDRPFQVRIGINTGIVVAGDIGTLQRQEYTVLGDSVNIAARLVKIPDLNRIAIGEATYEKLEGRCPAKDLGEIVLKGKQKPVRVYEIEMDGGG